jgi:hypothetical protein
MTGRPAALLALSLAGWLAPACGLPRDLPADRLDVALRVRPDGAVDVAERWTIRPSDGRPAVFERRIAGERADRIAFVEASADGRILEPGGAGEAGGRLQVSDGRALDVTFTVPPRAEGGGHVLELTYRAEGAVAVRGARGTLRHVVLEGPRTSPIASMHVSLEVPPDQHVFDGTGIAEAGWSVTRTPTGIAAERRDVGPGDRATVVAELSIDTSAVTEPAWQRHEEWSGLLVPAFLSGGLFILVVGAGILWIIRFQYPSRPRGADVRADDRERRAARAGLRTGGIAAVAVAVALSGVAWLTLGHLGFWPLAVPVSVLIVGLTFLALSPRFP